MILLQIAFLVATSAFIALAGSVSKPHVHNGVLEPYDGKPLPLHLTVDQLSQLEKGEAVFYKERVGKSGRGVVIQDINASTLICMERIRDLDKYPKVVPHVSRVTVYENKQFPNGTSKTGAEFGIGVMGLKLQYFLQLTHEPKYNTLTWTLDYKRNSDLDDSVGHWQVMTHPSKSGWTRILYSTKIKLFSWVPEFVVNALTNKALSESTSWVKRESELEAQRQLLKGEESLSPTRKFSWFNNLKGGAVAPKTSLHSWNSIDDLLKQRRNFVGFRFTSQNFRSFRR
jgi:ribosome-associated toxin RatA of RatAB toxin-antitoxin module